MFKKILMIAGAVAFVGAMAWSIPAQAADNDHYAGYQVKSKLTKGQTGTLANAVEAAGNFQKCKAKYLLVPTVKNGGPAPANASLQYLCHQCKGGKPSVPFTVTDQFVGGDVTAGKLKLVCNIVTP